MWKCPNCETLNESETCIVCGQAKVVIEEISMIAAGETHDTDVKYDEVCDYCGSPLRHEAKFCPRCGRDTRGDLGHYIPKKSMVPNIIATVVIIILVMLLWMYLKEVS